MMMDATKDSDRLDINEAPFLASLRKSGKTEEHQYAGILRPFPELRKSACQIPEAMRQLPARR
jgi:hypothetical protein